MKRSAKRIRRRSNLVLLIGIVGIGLLGSWFLRGSFADSYSHNPVGEVDSCSFDGTNTIIRGWAYDPDAGGGSQPYARITVGGITQDLPTNIDNYRDAPITTYIHNHYPGAPTPGTYGWITTLSKLYKGQSYAVSGIALNYGSGANGPINRDTGTSNLNSNNTLPDACLATAPAPTPTPAPPPIVTKPPAGNTGQGSTGHSGSTPAAAPTLSSAADATVSAGTLGANIKVPAGGATSIHIAYGPDPSHLINSTPDASVSGSDVTIPLDGLDAKTSYSYQIVRSNSGGTVTAASASFSTKGYALSVTFQDADGKAISGIKGSLANTKKSATSNRDGTMSFNDLAGGSYTVEFNYKGQDHTLDYNTDSIITAPAPDQTAVLSDSIDISQFASKPDTDQQTSGKRSVGVTLFLIFLVLLVLGAAVWLVFFLRRRRSNTFDPLASYSAPPSAPPATDAYPLHPAPHTPAAQPPMTPLPTDPSPGHESLRDMVIKSMHEQAMAKKQQGPPPPPPKQ